MMTKRGFTLIEMIVSVAIFSIVMLVAASAYLNLIGIDRQTRATNDVVNNLSFAIDSMARAIRTGTNYQCGGPNGTNCWANPSSEFTFVNDSGQTVTYLLNTTTHSIGECTGALALSCSNATATYFTDPHVDITTLSFYVRGVGKGDGLQPQVLLLIHGTLTTDAEHQPTTFSIETEATERGIDI